MKSGPPGAQTRRKKEEKIGPVQLVNHFILIIATLSNVQKGKNEIFRSLQKPKEIFPSLQNYEIPDIPNLGRKPNTLEAIKYLEQGKLIQRNKESKDFKKVSKKKSRKEIFKLTAFGCEVAKFIDSINSFVIEYSNFKKQYNEKFPFSSSINIDNKNKFKLEQNGWKREETKNYLKYLRQTDIIEYDITNAYIQSLFGRYISILLRYDITNFGKQILGTILLETLNKFIQSKNESLKNLQLEDKILFFTNLLSGDFYKFFIKNSPPSKSNKFIEEYLDKVLKSLCKILSPPSGYFKKPVIIGSNTKNDDDLKENMAIY